MSEMQVRLTDKPAPRQWGDNALVSADTEGMTIHAGEGDQARVQRAARQLRKQGITRIRLCGESWSLENQWAFYQGHVTAKDTLAGGRDGHTAANVELVWSEEALTTVELEDLLARVEAANWLRKVTNQSPEDCGPEQLTQSAADWLKQQAPEAVSVHTIKGSELAEQGWVGVYNVGRGSERPPVMLEVDYNPTGSDEAPIAAVLVGKGITFDSGGYSIKTSQGMLGMKADMGGAATVTAALGLAIRLGLKRRVTLILCCAENLISGHAYKLGDVLTYKNGVTVEIVNSDAEGRIVLADGLLRATELGAPLIIDAATLTGAAVTAVGSEYNALFSLDQPLQNRVLQYADAEHELHWPLPLAPWHKYQCPSAYADTANSRPAKGGGPGGASNAAGFLSRFVEPSGKGWLHFDLAASFQDSGSDIWAAGATGHGFRTIARTLLEEC